jgi:hypothetical protein
MYVVRYIVVHDVSYCSNAELLFKIIIKIPFTTITIYTLKSRTETPRNSETTSSTQNPSAEGAAET